MDDASPWASIFIITRDSVGWLGHVLDFYRTCGLEPEVLLDARTSDGTEALLKARRTPYSVVEGDAPRVEALVRRIADVRPQGWALRMDDDEVPSRGLAAFLRGPPPPAHVAAVAAPRWHLWRDELGRMRRGRWTEGLFKDALEHDWQWRLFQPGRVSFLDDIHTPGFAIPDDVQHAPRYAAIAHLVWIVRSVEERRTKIAAYDAQKLGAGSFFKSLYLPEEADGTVVFEPVGSSEFDRLGADLAGERR